MASVLQGIIDVTAMLAGLIVCTASSSSRSMCTATAQSYSPVQARCLALLRQLAIKLCLERNGAIWPNFFQTTREVSWLCMPLESA